MTRRRPEKPELEVWPKATAKGLRTVSRPGRPTARPVEIDSEEGRTLGARPPTTDAVGAPASQRVLRSQGKRTMRRLLDAAMVAFDRRGYHATRVNDIVEIAKTSHGTFYLYFSNKEDLLRALVAEAAADSQKVYDSFSTLPDPGGMSSGRTSAAGYRPTRTSGSATRRSSASGPSWPRSTGNWAARSVTRSRGSPTRSASTSGRTRRATTSTPARRHSLRWPCSTASTTSASSSASPSTMRRSTRSPRCSTGRSSTRTL